MINKDNILEYKGYVASLHYSHEDLCFFGKVEYIEGLITFESDNAKDLEINFKEAIDDYIDTCEATGVEPQKTFSGKLLLRLDRSLHKEASIYAKASNMSVNKFCIDAIEYKMASC